MKFFVLLYCLSHPNLGDTDYDCVTVSVHAERQHAVNTAHEWCVMDHVCIHHTYLQELQLHDDFQKVPHPAPEPPQPGS